MSKDTVPLSPGMTAAIKNAHRWQPLTRKYRRAATYTTDRPDFAEPLALLEAHRLAHAGHIPDAMKDGKSVRRRRAQQAGTLGRLQWLEARYGGLALVRLDLSHLDALPLYSRELVEAAHTYVRAWLHSQGLFGTWKLERGRNRVTHSHVVTDGAADMTEAAHAEPADDLEGLAEYLAKPADAGANAPKHKEKHRWTPDELNAQLEAACEDYLKARALLAPGERLPKLSGNNLPKAYK